MAKYTATLSADGSVYVCNVHRDRNLDFFTGTVFITGTFGGGTVVISASLDSGTTKITLPNPTGVAITANAAFNFTLAGQGDLSEDIKIYATISGSTAPTVVISVYDQR
jgi:hypothetical protein